MDEPARWSQVERIFHAALDLDAAGRAEFVRTECGGDEELRDLVESLLQHDSTETDLGSSGRKRIGPYELLSKLGAGGMGEVYLARDTGLGRQVAIKILPAQFADSPERKRRFLSEAKVVSRLNHANIATVHDIGTDQATDYIVMEYVPGKTLDHLIPHSGLKLGEALQYAVQIAAALDCAHAAGVVHRDLKPANVMITDSGVA